ncbi:sulfate adenylyltransferase subunit CysD [Cryptosporangium aurantiacum]|uniref:Sulfate adenylyltransferase subunit 2 n=1 Tax=Cryptosporangium aurantiacum TaxID=134849 RepID=A0A1M7RPK7_9ACTN|nr:sulfate adenylyltransferase subunit CysD [Cryptosporangium aurantiacum]SHN48008.1 sulfate adenylyltransferase subunit 2 [Cryptosporangium aurantiacum]
MSRVAGLIPGHSAPGALDLLEAEAIHVLREAAGQFDRPALLFSGGKDSAVLLHVATRAFGGAPLPFPLLHVDTGHNFAEVIDFRDRRTAETGTDLVVAHVEETIAAGRVSDVAQGQSRNALQSRTLLDAIEAHKFDALIGGARRDEEKARAKERVFSLRDAFGGWDPHRQRPELWRLYNGAHQPGENVRIFPLSNWTELDVWRYIARENIELPPLYYAHERDVVERDGMLLAITEWSSDADRAAAVRKKVRYRTVGDAISTGAVESDATDAEAVLTEVTLAEQSERGATRADDRTSDAAMEDRKREGYF